MRISDWSSDVCSSDLHAGRARGGLLMRWKLPWPKLAASSASDDEQPDGWQRHVDALRQAGIPEPGEAVQGRRPATVADEQALYDEIGRASCRERECRYV